MNVSRRDLLTLAAGGGSLSGLGRIASCAESAPRKSCILLWMDGGPSQTDTFDPKPDAAASVRGELDAIDTAVPGIQISERFPRLAQRTNDLAIIRSMSTSEADHGRARIYMHTGYRPGAGGVTYPGLGSTIGAELGRDDSALPQFVVTGTPLNKYDVLRDPGYRGPLHQPLVLADLSEGLEHVQPTVSSKEFNRRVGLLEGLERGFSTDRKAPAPDAHAASVARALKLIRSDRSQAFDLSREPETTLDRYGKSDFGRGCLLARRLVETGVAFVEVYLSNWDSHGRDVAQASKGLMSQVDLGMSALLDDLRDRGLLDSTLIVWMGEFGRTPRVNTSGGRDHYAKAWSVALAGGGIRGGQTIGRSDAQGAEVVDRPVSAVDLMATLCRILGIDYTREILTPNGRPIRIVDKGERLIEELIGS